MVDYYVISKDCIDPEFDDLETGTKLVTYDDYVKLDIELTKWKEDTHKYYKKLKSTEAELFNLKQHYEIVYDNYCNLADFLAEKLGKKNTDEVMDEFKEWLVKK